MKKETYISEVIHRLSLPGRSMQRTRMGLLAVVTLMTMIGCGNHDDSAQGQNRTAAVARSD
jgi:hypothetical protein